MCTTHLLRTQLSLRPSSHLRFASLPYLRHCFRCSSNSVVCGGSISMRGYRVKQHGVPKQHLQRSRRSPASPIRVSCSRTQRRVPKARRCRRNKSFRPITGSLATGRSYAHRRTCGEVNIASPRVWHKICGKLILVDSIASSIVSRNRQLRNAVEETSTKPKHISFGKPR